MDEEGIFLNTEYFFLDYFRRDTVFFVKGFDMPLFAQNPFDQDVGKSDNTTVFMC